MLSWGLPSIGSKKHNHWAVGGCLEKLDRLQGSEAQSTQLQLRSRGPADALETLFSLGGRYDTFNAGHCNQEAMRAAYFADPVQPVERNLRGPRDDSTRSRVYTLGTFRGLSYLASSVNRATALAGVGRVDTVEFEPSDIRGLMVLCMDDLVDRSHGNGGFEYVGYRYKTPPAAASEVELAQPWHDLAEPYPHEVIDKVCRQWGARDHRGIIADCKPGQLLDNRMFDAGRVNKLHQAPSHFDASQTPAGGKMEFFHVTFRRLAEEDKNVNLDCWIHTADDGTVTSNWIRGSMIARAMDGILGSTPQSANPDFYWIAHVDDEVRAGAPWVGFADSTNPDVDMFEVWTLWQQSIGNDWRQLAKAYPDRVRAQATLIANKQASGRVKYGRDLLAELGIPQPGAGRSGELATPLAPSTRAPPV